jgi:hypothetical protein
MHRVDGVKLGPCRECLKRLEEKHSQAPPAAARQVGLFTSEDRGDAARGDGRDERTEERSDGNQLREH